MSFALTRRAAHGLSALTDCTVGGASPATSTSSKQLSQAEDRADETLSAQQQADWGQMERQHDWEQHGLKHQHQRNLEAVCTPPPPQHHTG